MGLVFELRCCDQDSVKIDARVRVTFRLDFVTVYAVTDTVTITISSTDSADQINKTEGKQYQLTLINSEGIILMVKLSILVRYSCIDVLKSSLSHSLHSAEHNEFHVK